MMNLFRSNSINKFEMTTLFLECKLFKIITCACWFWILSPLAFASSQALLQLNSQTQVTSAGKELKFLTGYTFEQAAEVMQLSDDRWMQSTKQLNFGFSQNKVWLKFYTRSERSAQFPLVLEFSYPHFVVVKVGSRNKDGTVNFNALLHKE
jgi:hypothetical protein